MTLTALTADRRHLNAGDIVNGLEFVAIRGDRKIMARKIGTVDGKNFAVLSYAPAALNLTVESAYQGPINAADYRKGGKFDNSIMRRVYEAQQGAL